jgi:hypothetical protein
MKKGAASHEKKDRRRIDCGFSDHCRSGSGSHILFEPILISKRTAERCPAVFCITI